MILDCNEIIQDRLWVGRFVRPEEVKMLRQMGITSVVSLQSDEDIATYRISMKKLLKALELAEIDFRRVPTQDFNQEAMANNLARAVAEVEAALSPRWAKVYIHCTAGINRGPTLAAAYLIRSRGFCAQEAHDFITARRHCSPYLELLDEYEASLRDMS